MIDRLELDDEAAGNEEVNASFSDDMVLVAHGDGRLTNESHATKAEFNAHCLFVDGLQEPRPEHTMNFYRRIEDDRCKRVEVNTWFDSAGVILMHVMCIDRPRRGLRRIGPCPNCGHSRRFNLKPVDRR